MTDEERTRLHNIAQRHYAEALLADLSPPLSRWSAEIICVGPRVGWNCCHTAYDLEGQLFRADQVPLLPLPDCDKWCACTYAFSRWRQMRASAE